jgi:hypothetical protein
MHELEVLLRKRVGQGLKRKAISKCSQWAKRYRIMGQPFPGKWTFEHHPWLLDMHDCKSELMVGQKSAQMGFTEDALNKAFFNIDIRGASVLYVLPASTPDARDFSTARFDPALENSDHLKTLFTDVKNIHHKRAGFANLYIRGSRSRSQMKSVPVAIVILDEVDEMDQKNISLVFERTSGQLDKQIVMVSTPTIDKYGINYYFRQTTQEHYFFRCPHCSKYTELIWPECVVITAEDLLDPRITETHLICKECKKRLPHESKIEWLSIDNAKWVPTYTDRLARGFHINQLYSMTVKPYELAQAHFRAQRDPADEQEFHNSKLGLTHEVEGARISDKDMDECIGNYTTQDTAPPNAVTTIGIDVGKWLHYEIDQWFFDRGITDVNVLGRPRVLKAGKVKDFEELDNLMIEYRIRYAVIDASPERRKAFEFAQRFFGYVRMCFYAKGITSKQINLSSDEELSVSVDRTSWMDMALGRFRRKRISLPKDISSEYRTHLKAPVRIYEKDSDGNPRGKYVSGNEGDHFAHARTYSEIALQLAVSVSGNQNIGDY